MSNILKFSTKIFFIAATLFPTLATAQDRADPDSAKRMQVYSQFGVNDRGLGVEYAFSKEWDVFALWSAPEDSDGIKRATFGVRKFVYRSFYARAGLGYAEARKQGEFDGGGAAVECAFGNDWSIAKSVSAGVEWAGVGYYRASDYLGFWMPEPQFRIGVSF